MLGVVLDEVVRALRDAASRSAVDDFWSIWSKNAEAGLFRAYALAGGPIAAGSSAFLGRGLLRIRSRRLGGRAAGGMGSSRLYRISQGDELINVVLSFLSTLLFLLFYSFVGVSNLLLMFLKVFGVEGLLNLAGTLW